jgi:hypothetical protein
MAFLVELVGNPLALAQLRMSANRDVRHERDVTALVGYEDAVVERVVNLEQLSMPFLYQQRDVVATPDWVRKRGRAPTHNWNRLTGLKGSPVRREDKGEMRRDSGRQGTGSDANTFDPLAIVVG